MMPLTLAAVGHIASLDIYSGHLVMIDSINHVSAIDNLPLWNNGDHWFETWTRTYATKLYFPDGDSQGYIQPARGFSHTFRVKNVTGLPTIACFSSNLREFSIINDTGSIAIWDSTPGPPNSFGLVQLEIAGNSIRNFVITNAPCFKILNVSNNQLTKIDLSTINKNWRSLTLSNNFLTTLRVTSSQGSESGREDATLDCSYNQLTSLTFDGYPKFLVCNNNSLPTSQVNTILSDLAASGVTGGTVDLSNQTPPAPPSSGPPDGIGVVATLTGNGWSVVTD
jgi:hypothetical protein